MPELVPVDHDPFESVAAAAPAFAPQSPVFDALDLGSRIQRDRFGQSENPLQLTVRPLGEPIAGVSAPPSPNWAEGIQGIASPSPSAQPSAPPLPAPTEVATVQTPLARRSTFLAELENPAVRDRLIAMTNAEVGSQGPAAQQAFMESIFNRATARGQTIAETLRGSYFPAITHQRAGRGVNDTLRAEYEPLISQVVSGSNVSNYATGNASGTVGFAGGPQTFAAGGERFGVEGPDRQWASSVGYGGGEAAPFDDSAFQNAAYRQRQGVRPEEGRKPGFATYLMEHFFGDKLKSTASLPERATHAAGTLQRQGDVYDPAPAMETAMMMVGAPGRPSGSVGSGVGSPIRAYHGSPHDFDRFDMSKIGTGEGAQAYGHGLYFAENEGVARSYRDALAASHNRRPATLNMPGNPFSGTRVLEADPTRPGRMYEVNINAHPDQFLDWDKPLAQMGPEVQQALSSFSPHMTGAQINESARLVPGAYRDNRVATENLRGMGIPGIKYLDQGSRVAPDIPALEQQISTIRNDLALRQAEGKPGKAFAAQQIARLEKEIVAAKDFRPSSNYVLFRDDVIEILRKYGLAGVAALPPAIQAAVSDHLVPVEYDPFVQ